MNIFNNTYNKLPPNFYQNVLPAKQSNPSLIKFNHPLAIKLGMNFKDYTEQQLADIFSGQTLLTGSEPIAQAYAGHQYGHFVPQLGDGRAILLGEILDDSGKRFDIQLKGSGVTPFSRRGDGLSPIGPVIREYLVSEAMYNLGIPTTRSLAAVATGETVYRENPLPGGILTRVAASHIRIGTFEYFAGQGDYESVKILADYCIDRHFSHLTVISENIYLDFFKAVVEAQASLIAKWMSIGFIHGVMNTDNMLISGETIDYGPCAFMDTFRFDQVYSYIDKRGRYAYQNQPQIALWNLTQLANCLVPIISEDTNQVVEQLQSVLKSFIEIYKLSWLDLMRKKLGILNKEPEDEVIINNWLTLLEKEERDYTLSFIQLYHDLLGTKEKFNNHTSELENFIKTLNERHSRQDGQVNVALELMKNTNPLYIPRNHNIEKAISAAMNGNFDILNELDTVLKTPFNYNAQLDQYKNPPFPEEEVKQTFCGT